MRPQRIRGTHDLRELGGQRQAPFEARAQAPSMPPAWPTSHRRNPPRGTRDFLPDDVRRREHVIGVVRDVYQRYGFEPLETPAFENIETLMGKYGEEGNQLIFKILKRGEHEKSGEADLALRYDLTVPLARVVARVSERAADAVQALSDSAGVARRSSGARPLPRVLPVRHRRDGDRRRRSSRRRSSARSARS